MKLKLLTAAMLAMAIAPMQANAATATGTINVTAAVVAPAANVVVAGPLAFGNIVQGSTGATATTSFDITVTNGVSYNATLTGPNNQGRGPFAMIDASGVNIVEYNLYKDATKAWNYSSNRTSMAIFGAIGTGAAQTYALYAETLLAAVAGNYTDTITITVTY